MQGIVAIAADFLRLRRQFLDTPIGGGETTKALVILGQMQALARILGVDLDTMNPPDMRNLPEPADQLTITPLPEYDMVLLTVPANDAPGYETPQWSAFLHNSAIVPLLNALLAILRQHRKPERGASNPRPTYSAKRSSIRSIGRSASDGHDGPGAA
jgi:hypothetical protein